MKRSETRSWIKRTALLLAIVTIADGMRFLLANAHIHAETLRLHVIAASDRPEDQRLKLQVRDAVLAAGAEIFDGSVTADEAEARIAPKVRRLKAAAERTLRNNGCGDTVKVVVTREYFPERSYENVTLPPGTYRAVKVTIGEGRGRNWWCVMFPPMCLPAACGKEARDAFTGEEKDIVTHPEKYRLRLKTVELCEKLLRKLRASANGED